jgi:hypothetical protein
MAVGYLVWLAAYVFKLINPISGVNVKSGWEMANSVGGMTFKVAIAAIVIKSGGGVIYDFFVVPVIQLGTAVAMTLNNRPEGTIESVKSVKEASSGFQAMNGAINGFMEGAACIIMDVVANGFLLIRYSVSNKASGNGSCFFPALAPFASGVMMAVAGTILVVQFPMKLINCLLRLAMVCVLMPFLIVCWVFNSIALFKGFVDKGVNLIINICTTFLFASLSVYILRQFLESFYDLPYENAAKLQEQLSIMPDRDGNIKLFFFMVLLLLFIFMVGKIPLFGKLMSFAASGAKKAAIGGALSTLDKGMDTDNKMSAEFSEIKEPDDKGGKANLNAIANNFVKARVYNPVNKALNKAADAAAHPLDTLKSVPQKIGAIRERAGKALKSGTAEKAVWGGGKLGTLAGLFSTVADFATNNTYIAGRREIYANLDQRFANSKAVHNGVTNYMKGSHYGVVRRLAGIGGVIGFIRELAGGNTDGVT